MNKANFAYRKSEKMPNFKPNYQTILWDPESENTYETTYTLQSAQKTKRVPEHEFQARQSLSKFYVNQSNSVLSDCMGQPFKAETTNTSEFKAYQRQVPSSRRIQSAYMLKSQVPWGLDIEGAGNEEEGQNG